MSRDFFVDADPILCAFNPVTARKDCLVAAVPVGEKVSLPRTFDKEYGIWNWFELAGEPLTKEEADVWTFFFAATHAAWNDAPELLLYLNQLRPSQAWRLGNTKRPWV